MKVSGNSAAAPPRGKYRWVVCALLFALTMVSYMDRQMLGLLKPLLKHDLGWSETDFGDIIAAFSLMYAFGYACGGRAMDWFGVKRGLSVAMSAWGVFLALHGAMASVFGFKLARGALGLAEGGNFPAAIKTVREWFPAQERALATGILNAGSNIGAIVMPIALPFVVAFAGWRAAFLMAAALGAVWVVLWLVFYETPSRQRRLSAEEYAYITSGETEVEAPRPRWLTLFAHRGVWAYVIGMLLASPVWWFYLNWVPGYLNARFGVNMAAAIAPLVTIYICADLGSIVGGAISSALIRRNMPKLRARFIAMAVMALCPVPVAFAAGAPDMWTAVCLIALAAAGHQGFAANLYTLVSDTMPSNSVSSVVGIGGFAAGIAGMFTAMAVGRILDATGGNYLVLFIGAACAYPIAVAIMASIINGGRNTKAKAI